MRAGLHFLVDVQDFSVLADVKGPARGEFAFLVEHTIGLRGRIGRIAQNRVVELKRLGVLLIGVRRFNAGGEVGDVKFANILAALTERLAFGRSTTGKRLGKPRQHHGLLSFKIGDLIRLAVAANE